MKKNLTFDLSILALSILTLLVLSSAAVITKGSCNGSVVSKTPSIRGTTITSLMSGSVTASISANRLSTVSGTKQTLNILLVNNSKTPFQDGSVIVSIFQQSRGILIMRSTVKTGVDLGAGSVLKSDFVWTIPAALPTGIYQIEVAFSKDGQVFKNGMPITNNPFGNSARMLISGDAVDLKFFDATNLSKYIEPAQISVVSPYADTGSNSCPDKNRIYLWATIIGALAVVMFGIIHLRDESHKS